MTTRPRLVQIVTIADSLRALGGQFASMRDHGFDVHAISSPGAYLGELSASQGVSAHALDMTREITPWRDFHALSRLTSLLREIRPDIVHAHTPKAGLLAMIAARRAGVPAAIYHLRGLKYVTARGWKRRLLIACERMSCRLADEILCVSRSLRSTALEERLAPAHKLHVLLNGGHGMDCEGRFHPDRLAATTRDDVRRQLGIPQDAVVIGFVGRIARDKGIIELSTAWDMVRQSRDSAHLLIVGPDESNDPVPAEILARLRADARVHFAGSTNDTPPLYAAMDVVCLPSYREGLPKVPLEAAAMRRPVVATRIPGCTDSIVDGKTGLLVPVKDSSSLAAALAVFLDDESFRQRCGAAGRALVVSQFSQNEVWRELRSFYTRMLARTARTPQQSISARAA